MFDYDEVNRVINEIENEMKRIGLWQNEPIKPEMYEFQEAFGADTMSFEQWIQFILIPRVCHIIKEKNDFPRKSNVSAYAVKNLDGIEDVSKLHNLLHEFDNFFK